MRKRERLDTVAVFGNGDDDLADLVERARAPDRHVVVCRMPGGEDDGPDDATARWPELETVGRSALGDLVDELRGVERIFRRISERWGPVVGVVIGWNCQLALGDFVRYAATLGAEIVAIEAPMPWSDPVTRTVPFELDGLGGRFTVVRMPGEGARMTRAQARAQAGGPIGDEFVRGGCAGPLTLDAANRLAARRRRDGRDVLAGRYWSARRVFDQANSMCLFADADELDQVRGSLSTRDLFGSIDDEIALGYALVVVRCNGFAQVEVSPSAGVADAVRVGQAIDEFEQDDEYEPAGRMVAPSGRLAVGNPWDLLDRPGYVPIVVEVPPGVELVAETFSDGGSRVHVPDPGSLIDEITIDVHPGGPDDPYVLMMSRDGTARHGVGSGRDREGMVSARSFKALARLIGESGCVDWRDGSRPDVDGDRVTLTVLRSGHEHRVTNTGTSAQPLSLAPVVHRVQRIAEGIRWRSS